MRRIQGGFDAMVEAAACGCVRRQRGMFLQLRFKLRRVNAAASGPYLTSIYHWTHDDK